MTRYWRDRIRNRALPLLGTCGRRVRAACKAPATRRALEWLAKQVGQAIVNLLLPFLLVLILRWFGIDPKVWWGA